MLSKAQLEGGSGDGFGEEKNQLSGLNNQSFYCSGGVGNGDGLAGSTYLTLNQHYRHAWGGFGDGLAVFETIDQIYGVSVFCHGTTGDGGSNSSAQGTLYPLLIYYNDIGDGGGLDRTETTTLNEQFYYCFSTHGDGFHMGYTKAFIYPLAFYLGGDGDGSKAAWNQSLLLGYGIWTGLAGGSWNNPSNWKYDSIPGINTCATIPANCPNYPVLYGMTGINYSYLAQARCYRLDVLQGGNIQSYGRIFINGIMTVSGSVTVENSKTVVVKLFPNGLLEVKDGGVLEVSPPAK
jgi:hypothetical protein